MDRPACRKTSAFPLRLPDPKSKYHLVATLLITSSPPLSTALLPMSRRSCPLLRLPNDILREILDHIEADPDRLVNLDRRGYLSQESFALPPLSTPNQGQDIGNVRLVCKALAELGAIHQFARITTRFSYGGFERLEKIAAHPHLAKHVKKFSYRT